MDTPVPPSGGDGQLLAQDNGGDSLFCFYDAESSELVIPDGIYVSSGQRSNLTAAAVPSSGTFTPVVQLPGCVTGDGLPNFNSMDCIIATAFNGAPAGCDTDPEQTDCILNYLPAFCADLVDSSATAGIPLSDANSSLEACAKAIPLGPCVANPSGAACASDLFAGIKFPVSSGNGSSSSKRSEELVGRQTLDSIFPKEDWDHAAEQFIIGIHHKPKHFPLERV